MAHFLCHLGCSHFGALLLDFYFTENRYELLRLFSVSGNKVVAIVSATATVKIPHRY